MLNSLKEFLENNKVYKKKKEQLSKKYKILCQSNDKFNLDLLMNLSDYKIKKIYDLFLFNFNNEKQRKKLEYIYQKAKLKEYPVLNKAHYYPIINKMNFLNDRQKKELDIVLANFENSYINTSCRAWYDLNFNEELTNKVLKFLYNNKMIEKTYRFNGDYFSKFITEEEYNKFVQYHFITKEQMDKWTDKQWENYNERFNEGYFCIEGLNDDERFKIKEFIEKR